MYEYNIVPGPGNSEQPAGGRPELPMDHCDLPGYTARVGKIIGT